MLDRISLFYWIRMDTIGSRDLFELFPLRRTFPQCSYDLICVVDGLEIWPFCMVIILRTIEWFAYVYVVLMIIINLILNQLTITKIELNKVSYLIIFTNCTKVQDNL